MTEDKNVGLPEDLVEPDDEPKELEDPFSLGVVEEELDG